MLDFLIKAILVFAALIALAGFSIITSGYANEGKRERCEARGGIFIENEFKSELSVCRLG